MNYRKGDKVRILDKTRDMSKHESRVYQRCMERGGFGFIDSDNGIHLNISYTPGGTTGGFNYSDVAPYITYVSRHDALNDLIQGNISSEYYTSIKSEIPREEQA